MPTRLLAIAAVLAVLATAGPGARQTPGQSPSPSPVQRPGAMHPSGMTSAPPAEPKRILATSDRLGQSVQQVAYQEDEAMEEIILPTPLDSGGQIIYEPVEEMLPMHSGGTAARRGPNWWWSADYLVWWTHAMDAPPLATRGSAADAVPAALGQPNTSILFGGGGIEEDAHSGGRFALGMWLDDCQTRGLEVVYVTTGEEATDFSASGNNVAVLGRPFFNFEDHIDDARLIADPDALSGNLDIHAATEFDTLEILYRMSCGPTACWDVDFLFGYRYAELDDLLRIDESTLSLAGPTAGTSIDLFDQFDTRNKFHGVEIGVLMERPVGSCWQLETVAKFAFGSTDHYANVAGSTRVNDGGDVTSTPGGLLALATNSGEYSWNDFSTMSELGLTLERKLRCGLNFRVGYSLVYWSDVGRAGRQIDYRVNPTQIPPDTLDGQRRPNFPYRTAGFWAQGLNLGLEYCY